MFKYSYCHTEKARVLKSIDFQSRKRAKKKTRFSILKGNHLFFFNEKTN